MLTTTRLHQFSDDFADDGAVTVEYAMLYLVVGALSGLLILIVSSEWFRNMIIDLIKNAIAAP